MKPIAENAFTITKSLFYEGMLRVSREGYGKFARKALLVLLGLWLILLVITLATQGGIAQALGYLVVLALAGLWICVAMPRSNAKRAFAQLQTQCDGDMHRVTRFYEDHMEIVTESAVTTIKYAQVTQMLTSKHLLVLTCADKRGILLALDGFSAGNVTIVQTLIEKAKSEE